MPSLYERGYPAFRLAFIASVLAAPGAATAAPQDPPLVSIEGAQIVQDASGVWVSPLDNPAVHVDMPLNVITFNNPGAPSGTIAEGVKRGDPSEQVARWGERTGFYANVRANCSPSDLLCSPIAFSHERPFRDLWPIPLLDTAGAIHDTYLLNAATRLPVELLFVDAHTPLVARSLSIGPSVSTVTVSKTGADGLVTAGTTQVRLDPEVIVVPVDVVFVVPDPRTPTANAAESAALAAAIHAMNSEFDVTGTVSGGNVVASGGDEFAAALFDGKEANEFTADAHPQGQPPGFERANFRYHTEGVVDRRGRELLSEIKVDSFEPPDPLWAQCGVQFRLRRVVRVVEADPNILHIKTNGADNEGPNFFCGANNGNTGLFRGATGAFARWNSLGGIDPSLPGIQLYLVPRIDRVDERMNAECETRGLSEPGFSIVPALRNRLTLDASTVSHELGHALGLDHLAAGRYCFQESDGMTDTVIDNSNLMCADGELSGHHLSGCDSWRADGAPGHNCVVPDSELLGAPVTYEAFICSTAREKARTLSGTQPSGPVACPTTAFASATSPSGMMDLNNMAELAAYAGGSLRINDRARLLATSSTYDNGPFAIGATLGSTRIGVEAKLKTLVTAGPSAQFTQRYAIESIKAATGVNISSQDGRDLNPITTRGIQVPYLHLDADFPSSKWGDLMLEPGQAAPAGAGSFVAPGTYFGQVAVKRGSVLRLGPGRYFFDSLDVQTGGILEMNHQQGHVEVYVRSGLTFSGTFRSTGGDPYANLFVFSGLGTAQVLEAFSGTLIATRGAINLENKVHQGAFYAAGMLELHQGGAIRYRRLACNP